MHTYARPTSSPRTSAGVVPRTAAAVVVLLVAALLSAVSAPASASTALPYQQQRSWSVPGSLNSGFGVARSGKVYFYDRVDRRIVQYGPAGKRVRSWTVDGSMYGLAVASNGRVVVLERGFFGGDPDRVLTFSAKGALIDEFEITGDFAQGQVALALAPNNDVYVASEVEVVRYSSAGEKLYDWGDTEGKLSQLTDLVVAPDGTVLVTDRAEHRVKRFSATGDLHEEWGQLGAGGDQIGYPTSIDVDAKGRVYVADPGEMTDNRRVQVFTPAGAHVGQIGGPKLIESTPRTVRVDGQGRVFVYDDGNHWGTYVRVFTPRKAQPRIVPNQVRFKGRTTKVRIRCTPGAGKCQGKLVLKHKKQNLAKRNFAVKAGKAKVFKVRLTKKGKRILDRQKPKRIRVVANPKGSKKVTRMVRRR